MEKNNKGIDQEETEETKEEVTGQSKDEKKNAQTSSSEETSIEKEKGQELESEEDSLEGEGSQEELGRDEQIEELNDKLIRKIAEFDNFRKRSEKEKNAMFEIGAKSVIEKILPAIDSFERGLSTVPQEIENDAFVEGMEKVYKQMMTCLEDIDVKPIEALGKQFDPNFHYAVMHEEDPDQEDNIIIDELQKGYTYRDNVVRYSMVKVVN